MRFGDILVCIDHTETGNRRKALALALAARSRANLIAYFLMPRQRPAVEDVFGTTMGDLLDPPDRTVIENASTNFEQDLKLHGLEGTCVIGNPSRVTEDIASYSRCVDLVVAGLGSPDDPDSPNPLDIEKVVIECGRPVLGIPVTMTADQIGTNIMIAWDGSREASRAMHDALPFLHEATTVQLVSIDRDSLAVASVNEAVAHLKRLGITATIDDQLDLRLPVGEEIFSRIERYGVDLLVAGAFGHSRLIEHIVGGVSRSLLHQMMVPVLVSH
jgi:nucleotide-binding universal stress UspA family protein